MYQKLLLIVASMTLILTGCSNDSEPSLQPMTKADSSKAINLNSSFNDEDMAFFAKLQNINDSIAKLPVDNQITPQTRSAYVINWGRILSSDAEGINKLSIYNPTALKSQVGMLCRNYVDAVEENSNIEEDAKEALISSFYLSILSLQHWSEIYANQ